MRALAGTAIVLLASVLVSCGSEEGPREIDERRPEPVSRELHFKGATYYISDPSGEEVELSFGKLLIQKRRFGPFSLNPLREVLATDAQLSIRRSPMGGAGSEEPGGVAGSPLAFSDFSVLGLGTITRIVMEGAEVEIWRGDVVEFRIVAGIAEVTSRRGHLDMEKGVEVFAANGEHLGARKGRLFGGAAILSVWGGYEWRREGADATRDSGAQFWLEPGGALRLESPAP